MTRIIDAALDLSAFANDIARAGVETVFRYYNHRNVNLPTKRLTVAEADALQSVGLSLATVFQQRGGSGGHIADLTGDAGTRDANRALELASDLSQPQGSAIYFAVDHDFVSNAEIESIKTYFASIRSIFGSKYRVGAYASGYISRKLLDEDLVDLIWIPQSHGWRGYSEFVNSQDWALLQGKSVAWPDHNFIYDPNRGNTAIPDFGQFSLGTLAAPA